MEKTSQIKLYDNISECCGCSACVSACHSNAISLKRNEDGFYSPSIEYDKCVHCGLCMRVCDFKKTSTKFNDIKQQRIYAVKNICSDILEKSSSGGVFYEIAKQVLDTFGVVYGAAFDDNFIVKHCRITDAEEIGRLMGSKYVQSDTNGVFNDVISDIKTGRNVLFSGTPCQVAGLKKLVRVKKIDDSKLLTIDIICHGVPNSEIFQNYLSKLENTNNSNLTSFTFRNKKNGRIQEIRAEFKNGNVYEASTTKDPFYRLFLYDFILRDSCFNCPYTSMERVADITLGDFWGYNGSLEKNMGISLVLINDAKGAETWECLKDHFLFEETTKETCQQSPLLKPAKKPMFRAYVMKSLKRGKWATVNIITNLIRVIKHFG